MAFFCRGQLRYFSMWGGRTAAQFCIFVKWGTIVVTDFIAPANGSG